MLYPCVPINSHKSFETEKLFPSSSNPTDKLPSDFSENGLSLSQKTLPASAPGQHPSPGRSALKGFPAGSVWLEGHACHLTFALHIYTGWMEKQRAGRAEDGSGRQKLSLGSRESKRCLDWPSDMAAQQQEMSAYWRLHMASPEDSRRAPWQSSQDSTEGGKAV